MQKESKGNPQFVVYLECGMLVAKVPHVFFPPRTEKERDGLLSLCGSMKEIITHKFFLL